MIIKELFKKEIDRSIQGVVTIGNENEAQKWQELEEYVCTDEIIRSFRIFFKKYRESIVTPTDKIGVWITGFFGSGKSHFLKILGYLLENEVVAGREPVKYFEEKISDKMVLADIYQSAKAKNKIVLFNIDSKAKSDSKNKSQAIMDIMIRAFNEAIGYCGSITWVADLERALDEEGTYKAFTQKFEELSGRNWFSTRTKALLSRDYIINTLVAVRNMTEESAKQFFDYQVKNFTNSTEEFAKIVNFYCKKNSTKVVFLMDEVGQFIGSNGELMLNLQTCVEDLGKFCKGQAWVVVTSQQELKDMIDSTQAKQNDFSKIQGRFDARLVLSGANADEVIKKRILEKKGNAVIPLLSMYQNSSSKLSNLILFQGKPSWSGYQDEDDFKNVYPFVSYQFELLQKAFESIREHGMSEGKHLSQSERSLLSAFQDSAKRFANDELGVLVPFDCFYNTIEQFVDYDVKTVFLNAEKRTSLNSFAIRVLRILFMIKHVKEMPSTLDRIATLMVSSINEDKAVLKAKIFDALKVLEEETFIQKNGDEYDFLTNAEQDVNKQINSGGFNEGEVQRNILDIIYDKIMDSNKLRYENKYEFAINRYVDQESKGSFNADNITIRIFTNFSGIIGDNSFATESARNSEVIVDLTDGTFIDELIKANKIAIFIRNNNINMSSALTEIMSKKSAESSDRLKRAEELIRQSLRKSPIYVSGQLQDIKEKDGKERLLDALKAMVKQHYYKLDLVHYFYNDTRIISEVLDESEKRFDEVDLRNDANYGAFNEIFEKIKTDSALTRKVTVKGLIDTFTKKPYGWHDLDVLGMLAVLWKTNSIQFIIHENIVDEKNRAFKNDFVRKQGLDLVVVKFQEKISDEILYKVKKIMTDVYDENIQFSEDKLKDNVVYFFTRKKQFLIDLKTKYGNDYVGAAVVPEMYKDFEAITRSNDPLTIFKEVIARGEHLEKFANVLEQLESFYRDNSSQQNNYRDATKIVDWYYKNYMLEDLSRLGDTIEQINDIINMELPFDKMNELSSLVFVAKEIKDRILQEKYNSVKKSLEKDLSTIVAENMQAQKNLTLQDEQKIQIAEIFQDINETYESWLSSISPNTSNLDTYINSSTSSVDRFRNFIATQIRMMEKSEEEKPNTPVKQIRVKRVRIADCVLIANKKITSLEDVDRVVDNIRERLLKELESVDEISID